MRPITPGRRRGGRGHARRKAQASGQGWRGRKSLDEMIGGAAQQEKKKKQRMIQGWPVGFPVGVSARAGPNAGAGAEGGRQRH